MPVEINGGPRTFFGETADPLLDGVATRSGVKGVQESGFSSGISD